MRAQNFLLRLENDRLKGEDLDTLSLTELDEVRAILMVSLEKLSEEKVFCFALSYSYVIDNT